SGIVRKPLHHFAGLQRSTTPIVFRSAGVHRESPFCLWPVAQYSVSRQTGVGRYLWDGGEKPHTLGERGHRLDGGPASSAPCQDMRRFVHAPGRESSRSTWSRVVCLRNTVRWIFSSYFSLRSCRGKSRTSLIARLHLASRNLRIPSHVSWGRALKFLT